MNSYIGVFLCIEIMVVSFVGGVSAFLEFREYSWIAGTACLLASLIFFVLALIAGNTATEKAGAA